MPLHPRTCSLLYSVSCLLDALDGLAARYFQQSTRFGAVLDMVTDRCTTACLLVFLSSAWPRWALLFQGLISLDLASHYMHMFATLTMAGSGQSHKKVDQSRSRILHLYYHNKVRRKGVGGGETPLTGLLRMSSLRSAPSTNCSSLRSISSPFLHQSYLPLSFPLAIHLGLPLSLGTRPTQRPLYLPHQVVRGRWSLLGLTRWTASGPGSSRAFHSP
jgi:hypothetical protein